MRRGFDLDVAEAIDPCLRCHGTVSPTCATA
jgi:hypothetical protein